MKTKPKPKPPRVVRNLTDEELLNPKPIREQREKRLFQTGSLSRKQAE